MKHIEIKDGNEHPNWVKDIIFKDNKKKSRHGRVYRKKTNDIKS